MEQSSVDIIRSMERRQEMLDKIELWVPKFYINHINDGIRNEALNYYLNKFEEFDGKLTNNGLIHYIRHQYTDYDHFIQQFNKYTSIDAGDGVILIYPVIKLKINQMIEQKFGLSLDRPMHGRDKLIGF